MTQAKPLCCETNALLREELRQLDPGNRVLAMVERYLEGSQSKEPALQCGPECKQSQLDASASEAARA